MVESIRENGLMIRCMDMANSHGQMENPTRVNTNRTKKKEKEDSTTEMDLIMKVTGLRGGSMGGESSKQKPEKCTKEDTNMAN